MGPLQPQRRVTPDRARRNPVSRLHHAQPHKVKAWSDAEHALIADAGSPSTAVEVIPPPARARGARVFLMVLIAVVAVNFGAMLGLLGWGVLQGWGVVAEPFVETVQREQAASISQLETAVRGLNVAVMGLSARPDVTAGRDEATNRRIAELGADVGALRKSITEVRAAQTAAAADGSWREPVAELAAAATRARSEIVRLRASLDDLSKSRPPDVAALAERVDSIEHAMVRHDLLGPIRGAIRETSVRPRPLATPLGPAPANGHIIDLSPAR